MKITIITLIYYSPSLQTINHTDVIMNNKVLFLMEILKTRQDSLQLKDFCSIGLCPVVLCRMGDAVLNQKSKIKIERFTNKNCEEK